MRSSPLVVAAAHASSPWPSIFLVCTGMLYIAPCAACNQPMLVDGARGRGVRFRCPSCGDEAEFGILEARAVPLPPAAIVIEQGLEQEATDASTCVASADGECDTTVAIAADFERPAEAPLDCFAVATNDVCSTDGRCASIVASEEIFVAAGALDEIASDAARDDGDAALQAADAFPDLLLEGTTNGQSSAIVSRGRRRGSSLGVLAGQLAGIVLGGVAGLTIGYALLLWIKGPRADFLDVQDRWRSMVDYVESWRIADPPTDRPYR